jgi:hypothetical protein
MSRALSIQAMFFFAVIALMAAVTVSQVSLVDGGYARAARTWIDFQRSLDRLHGSLFLDRPNLDAHRMLGVTSRRGSLAL